tara:strand:+ start:615 stop:1079 length:465 start_codon:yes stop_codon:yes gene_type:complete
MSSKIWFQHNVSDKIKFTKRKPLSIININDGNFLENTSYIDTTINTFNSEIQWDGMWNRVTAHERVKQNHTLFILLENNTPIGHLWYDSDYVYNVYVSKERQDGDASWFVQETMLLMNKEHSINTFRLYVDEWNDRAKGFFEKIGYTKNELLTK